MVAVLLGHGGHHVHYTHLGQSDFRIQQQPSESRAFPYGHPVGFRIVPVCPFLMVHRASDHWDADGGTLPDLGLDHRAGRSVHTVLFHLFMALPDRSWCVHQVVAAYWVQASRCAV